jgi:tryptophan 7-halogenase
MSATLSPTDLLYRDPSAQAVALPDGRLLVRHRRGVSLLGGIPLAVLRRVLSRVDGRRTAAEVCAGLVEYGEERVHRLLASLAGELVEVGEAPARARAGRATADERLAPGNAPAPRGGEVVVIGNGRAARRLAVDLARAGAGAVRIEVVSFAVCRSAGFEAIERLALLPPRQRFGAGRRRTAGEGEQLDDATAAGLAARLRGAAVVVCALESMPYRALLEAQAACVEAGVPSLFLTADPDGLRVGPTTVPGVSPCLACAQLAAFGVLRLPPQDLLAAAGLFRTGNAGTAPHFGRAVAALVAEVAELLGERGEPSLLGQVLLVAPDGAPRRLPVERTSGCPLCGDVVAVENPAAERAGRILAESLDRRAPRAVPGGEESIRSVGILGGGTAGYLAALALRRKLPHLAVTLIESSDVPIIGVGEATTPLMPQFLHVDLGLDVHRLFREVRPTFKLGIRFLWGAPGEGDFNYPFGPLHLLEPAAYGGDLRDVSLQSMLMAAGAVPVYGEGAGWTCRLGTGTAYHLDNERFVGYLQRRAAELGVERIDATVDEVEGSADGEEVQALVTRDGRRLVFDLYVDCTGFRALLLEQALGSPWVSFAASLFTDRAIVGPVPHGGRVRPYTTAETMRCGWCWSTPQADADHRGYVFASAFLSPEEAEAEMRRANPGMGPARIVRFRAGRHEHFWKGNVVALGNAYGFVEPLESTALHMLIRQIGLLVRSFPARRGDRGLAALLDRKVALWWDYLRWFLAIHYKFNRRLDTPFWRACRAEVDVSSHAELLAAFRERGPLSYDPAARAAFDYPDPLWGPEGIDTLLLGQQVPTCLPWPALPSAAWRERLRLARAAVARATPHERALDLLTERPELLEAMLAAFRAAGPAFPVG